MYFLDMRVFLLLLFGIVGAQMMLLSEKVYTFLFLTSRNLPPKDTHPMLLIVVTSISLIGAGFLFIKDREIQTPGFLLALAISCLHGLLREVKREAVQLT